MWRNCDPYILLVEMKKDAVAAETVCQFLRKLNRITTWPSISIPRSTPQELKTGVQILYMNGHSSTTQWPRGGNHPNVHQRINKQMCSIHTLEHCSAPKGKKAWSALQHA